MAGMTLEDLARKLDARFDSVDRRFNAIDQRLEAIDRRFNAIDQRFEVIDQRFNAIDQRFEVIDQRFDAIDQRFEAVDQRFDAIDQRFEAVDRRFEAMTAANGLEFHHIQVHFAEMRLFTEESVGALRRDVMIRFDRIDIVLERLQATRIRSRRDPKRR